MRAGIILKFCTILAFLLSVECSDAIVVTLVKVVKVTYGSFQFWLIIDSQQHSSYNIDKKITCISLTLLEPTPQNFQTHSNNSLAFADSMFDYFVGLTSKWFNGCAGNYSDFVVTEPRAERLFRILIKATPICYF